MRNSFDFGDGSPVVGPQMERRAEHVYTSAGSFTVTLTVINRDGQTSRATRRVDVTAANLSFESGLSGWNSAGSTPGVELAQVPGGRGGGSAAQLANGGSTAAGCVLNDAPNWVATTGNGRYVASLWARSDAPGGTLKLKLREYRKDTGALEGAASSALRLTTSWQQVSVAYMPRASGASTLDYSASLDSVAAGSTCFDADDAAIDFLPAPVASLTTGGGPFDRAPVSVRADASASTVTDLPIASYTFDFGDGSPVVGPQTEPTADHTYWATGSFTVTVTVTDTDGRSSTAHSWASSQRAFVHNPGFENGTWDWNTVGSNPGVTLTQVPGGHSGASAVRVANDGTTAGSCVLNDAPNSVETGSIFDTNFRFRAWLWVRADAPGATLKLKLREYRKDTGALLGTARRTITLTTSWQLVSVAYQPVAPGASTLDYNAYVDNAAANSTCFYADDAVLQYDTASLSITPTIGATPLSVWADASASTTWYGAWYGAPIASYRFDFGDGSPIVGPQAEPTAGHTYTSSGTYTVMLTVTDTAGKTATTAREVTAAAGIVTNSSFESGTAGWNSSGSGPGVTLTQVPGGHTGAFAARLANTGTAPARCVLNDAPNWIATTTPGTHTATLWVRSDAPGATLKLKLREYRRDTGALLGTATRSIALTTSWQPISVSYEPLAAGASTLDYIAYVDNAAPAETCFSADDAAITVD